MCCYVQHLVQLFFLWGKNTVPSTVECGMMIADPKIRLCSNCVLGSNFLSFFQLEETPFLAYDSLLLLNLFFLEPHSTVQCTTCTAHSVVNQREIEDCVIPPPFPPFFPIQQVSFLFHICSILIQAFHTYVL